MTETYAIKGMACQHCRATVEKALSSLEGVESVTVNLSEGSASVEGKVDRAKVIEAIERAGFEFAGEK